MRAVSVLAGSESAYATGLHSSVAVRIKRSPEEVFEALLDDDATEKEIAAGFF